MITNWDVFDEVCTTVWYTDNTYTDGTKETKQVKRLINQATLYINKIAKSYQSEAKENITLTAATNSYAIPSDVDKISQLYFTETNNKYIVKYLEPESFLQLESIDSTSERFMYWTIRENKVYLFPTPITTNNVVTIIYKKKASSISVDPSASTNQTDTFGIMPGFGNLIVAYCVWHIYMQREQNSLAQSWKTEFEETVIRYKDDVYSSTTIPVITPWAIYNTQMNLNPIYTNL